MIKKFLLYCILGVALLGGCISCEDTINVQDDFYLEFSTDTLRFDTLFTQLSSTTHKLKIYNKSSQRALIESIQLAQGQYYALNINGLVANHDENVYLNAHDSMLIFVQAELPANDETRPFIVRDSILFRLNNKEQRVQLQAYGRNAIWLNDAVIENDTVFTDELPYLISGTLHVKELAKLTLEPGTHLYFRKHAQLLVEGQLISQGELGNPVLLRGDRDDYMNTIPPLNYDLCSGQWGGVIFKHTSKNNLLSFTDVRNADFGIKIDSTDASELSLRIENSQVRNMIYSALTVVNGRVEVYNSLIYNAGSYLIAMYGGHLEWLQCTLANYYQFSWGGRTQPILLFSNHWSDETHPDQNFPLYFTMVNSIVYGSYASEMTETLQESEKAHSILFQNCLLKHNTDAVVTNPPFDACVFKKEPLFVFQSWEEGSHPHVYDFHLQEGSGAQGIGNVKAVPADAVDLDGNPRLLDGTVEAGCYEIVK